MIRASLLALLFTGSCLIPSKAQLPDDVPDFRSKRESITKMPEKDIQSDLATFTMAGIDLFAGQPKLKRLPVTSYDNRQVTSSEEDLSVQVTAGKFDPAKHKLNYVDKYLLKIDGKGYFGGYGTIPKTTVAAISVVLNEDTIAIPATAYADVYNPDFVYTDRTGNLNSYVSVYRSADKRKIYIYLLKREDSGSYEVTWVIQDKKYLRRVVDFGFLKQ